MTDAPASVRYFFDVQTSAGVFVDTLGSLLPADEAVHTEAVTILQELLRDELSDGQDKHYVATVRREGGPPLFAATLSVSKQWLDKF